MHKLNIKSQYYENINLALAKYIPENKEILDVGAGYGTIWEKLKSKNNHVVALDSNETSLNIAKNRVQEMFLADITNLDQVKKQLKERKFDYIILADVLEHVYDPFSVLELYKAYLKPNGKLLISIPNVCVWYIRLSILFGNFNYKESGVLDRTHIRFFTLDSFRTLLRASDLKIIKEDFNPGIFTALVPIIRHLNENKKQEIDPRSIYDSNLNKVYLKYVFPIEKLICASSKRLFAFQLIFVVEKEAK